MVRKLKYSTLAIFAGLALFAVGASDTKAQDKQVVLRVANYGGLFTEVQRKYAGDLFTKRTGVKVQYIDANPSDHLAKMIASRGREAPFDVVYLDGDVQSIAAKANVLTKVDASQIPNMKYLYPEAKNKDGYGPAMMFYSIGLMYNKKKLAEAGIPEPKSWSDLWDPKLVGHIAIPDLSSVMGRSFLVGAARLAGGDESTLGKGIDKIASLKVHSYYSSTVQLEALLSSGDVWAAPMSSGRAWGLIDRGLPMAFISPSEKAFGNVGTLDIVAGTKLSKEAAAYIDTVLDPYSQLGQAYEIPYGPTNTTLQGVMTAYPELSKKFPSSPESLSQLYMPNWSVYYAHHQEAVDLWNRKVLSK
jgi:putative spermidine/putrescine transport system substrate-binding protein